MAINESEETVKCVATDPDCIKRAKEAGKKVENVKVPPRPPVGSHTMKCTITDSACMKQAKQLGKKVGLVEEADLDDARLPTRIA